MDAKRIVISPHARFEMRRRGINVPEVLNVVQQPGQVLSSEKGKEIRQSLLARGHMLLRVVVKETPGAYYVITAYKTSKLGKYWVKS